MPRSIAALFEDRGRAEGALQALLEAGIAGYQSALLACQDPRQSELAPGRTVSPDEGRFGAALRELGLPQPDAAEFEEAVRRGGCLLTVRVDSGTIDEAIALVGAFDPVDLDRRAARSAAGSSPGAPLGAGLTAGAGPGTTNTAALPGMAGMAQSTGRQRRGGPAHPRGRPARPRLEHNGDRRNARRGAGRRAGDARARLPQGHRSHGARARLSALIRSRCARGAAGWRGCARSRGRTGRGWYSARAR